MPDGGVQPGEVQPAAQQDWLTKEDKQTLVVTFAGSVAANLVTVLAVGAGLALVHYVRAAPIARHHHAVTDLLLLAAGVVVVYGVAAWVARARARHNRGYKMLYLVARIFVALALFAVVIALIGVASGFK
jgi:hypothetical protein